VSNSKVEASLYPIPTPERRRIVQKLAELAAELDAEVRHRTVSAEADGRHDMGSWNAMVADELARSAGTIRFVATLIIQGGMSTTKARFWLASTVSYIKLVRRADNRGVIL
jgi:hypothetical protein